jgi:hypothetical protein
MPNKTASFYQWVFLNCLPSLLGQSHLHQVRVMITDGDSQEFNAVDESIFVFFTRVIRIRCDFHLVEKTYEKDGPFHRGYLDSSRAYSLVTAIKCWVYSWMRGDSCHTEDEYELSKQLLLATLTDDKDVLEILGQSTSQKIRHWLNTKVFPIECSYIFHKRAHH